MSPWQPACWVSLAIAAFSSADGQLSWGGPSAGSEAESMARRDIISINDHLFMNMTNSYNLTPLTNHDIIFHPQAFHVALPDQHNGTHFKRDDDTLLMISFETKYGNHSAIAMPHFSSEDLINSIAEATPGVMKDMDRLTKRDDGFSVDWLSYNFDNVNHDLSGDWQDDSEHPDVTTLQLQMNDFAKANPGWKYCMNAVYSDNPNEPADANHPWNLENAYHGELYFNTYGGVDGQCNENLDCMDDTCGN